MGISPFIKQLKQIQKPGYFDYTHSNRHDIAKKPNLRYYIEKERSTVKRQLRNADSGKN